MRPAKILLYGFVALVLTWLIIPVVITVPMSFSAARFLTFPPPALSLRWYEAYLGSDAWMQATRVTLIVAVSSAVITTMLGTMAAYALNMTSSRLTRGLQIVLLLPLVVPIVITAVGVYLVFVQLGLLATMTGLVLANIMLGLPFVITSVLVGFRKFDATQEMVSRSLGMNRIRTFFIVTLPQIRPSVVSGMLFAFISAIDETVISLFISGGANQTLTKRMFTALRDEIDPTIAAISTLMTAISFIAVILVAASSRRAERSRGDA
ncbi:putative spermidine/putrescine transport system permease protein [Rhizobium aquaticum]|uniref:Spermidine/putrescine transport system permease protein n=1 Tax=Rhizobium aquaticum TaxID=1549636 RepID=A0ABV2J5Y5_9HYPH